jgi:negative regulator of flagellin synthesis FlgM
MKITHNKVGQNLNLVDTAKAEKTSKADAKKEAAAGLGASTAKSTGDATKVSLSDRAQEMKKIKEMVGSPNQVDEAKVARLQKMIDEGKYKVDAKAVADKLVDEQLLMS